jgi:hypothetical protein
MPGPIDHHGIPAVVAVIPVISANTPREERARSYFWREGTWPPSSPAGMAPATLPACRSSSTHRAVPRQRAPSAFIRRDFATFPGASPTRPFVAEVKSLFDGYRRRIGHA